MFSRWKFDRVYWSIMGILLFLACILACIPSHSLAQSPLSFQLASREEKSEAFPCQNCHQDIPVGIGQESTKSQEHTPYIDAAQSGLRCLGIAITPKIGIFYKPSTTAKLAFLTRRKYVVSAMWLITRNEKKEFTGN